MTCSGSRQATGDGAHAPAMPSPGTQSLALRYVTLSGANLLAMGLGFAVMLVVARRFGPAGLGRVALAQSVLGYALTVGLWGTDLLAIQRVASRPETLRGTVRVVRHIRLRASLLAYVGVVALALLVPALRDVAPLVALFALSVFAAAFSPEWVPQAQHRTGVTAVANLATQGTYLSLVTAVALAGAGVWGVAAAKAIADFVVMAGLVVWLTRFGRASSMTSTREDTRRFAADAAPICATQLVRSIALSSDVVLLGFLVSRTTLGHYAGASRIFTLLLSLATAYFVILLPRFAERGVHSVESLRAELSSSLRRTVPLAAAAVLGCALLADFAISLLFGPGFSAASPALRLLSVAAAANLVGRHYRQVLLVLGRQRTDLRLTVGGAVVHVVAKLTFIPLLGITGAALGAVLGEGFLMIAQWRAAKVALERAAVVPAAAPLGPVVPQPDLPHE